MSETKNEVIVTENPVTVIVRENDDYQVLNVDGKFVRKAKYQDYSSIVAESRADKIWLMNLMDGDEETGNGLKDQVGKQIEVSNIITRKYDKINEDTGEMEYGVLTYLINPAKQVFVTSSKNVYFSIKRIMDLFGTPDKWVNDDGERETMKVKVLKEKGTNGDMIKIKLIG